MQEKGREKGKKTSKNMNFETPSKQDMEYYLRSICTYQLFRLSTDNLYNYVQTHKVYTECNTRVCY